MNRLDDAVVDLFADLPPGPGMDDLKKRARRYRGRRAITVLVVVSAITLMSISVAGSSGHRTDRLVVTSSSTTTRPTTTPTPSFSDCGPGLPATFSTFDHATHLPTHISRAYWCRRLAELQPSPDAHLEGSIYVANGKVTAEYHHTKDVISVDANGNSGDTIVASKTIVPIDQLPPALQHALRNP
jgi:hypothetical protein